MRKHLILLPILALVSNYMVAQKAIIDKRDQAQGWYLPVHCEVTANGGKTDNVTVTIFKDNAQVMELKSEKKKSNFELELDIDGHYTIRVRKEGYREKLVHVDTNLPKDQVKYGAYTCFVNLEPMDKFAYSDPYYLDFPSALVRWDDKKKCFNHIDAYVNSIQLKMALLGAQVETK